MKVKIYQISNKYVKDNYHQSFFCRCDDREPPLLECEYCERWEEYDKWCPCQSWINCSQCNNRTSYGCTICCDCQMYSYYCNDCSGYFCICSYCAKENEGELMKLIEQHNWYYIKGKTDDYKIVEYKDIDNDTPNRLKSHILYKKPVYIFDENKFGWITGPDGGYTSTWYCESCDKEFELGDL